VRLGPFGELFERVSRGLRQGGSQERASGAVDCLPEQRVLGAEVAEEGDLIDPRLEGDATRGGPKVADFGVDLRGGVEELVPKIHGGRV